MAEEDGVGSDEQSDSGFVLRLLEPGDKVTGFSLGDPKHVPLKIFLTKHAIIYQVNSLARTYAVFDENQNSKIISYITLVCGEVSVEKDSDTSLVSDVDFSYKNYPAVKIARLAVDKRYKKSGIGRSLVDMALGIAKDIICPSIGCRFVVVDAKSDAVSFYIKCGFTLLDTPENRGRESPVLFVDLHKTQISTSANTQPTDG